MPLASSGAPIRLGGFQGLLECYRVVVASSAFKEQVWQEDATRTGRREREEEGEEEEEEEGEEEEEEEETSGRRQASFRVLDLSAAAYDSPFRGDSKSEEPTAQFSIDYRFCFVQSIGH